MPLLKKDGIEEVMQQIASPIFGRPNVYFHGLYPTSIIVSSNTGLILIKGDDDTGMEHIIRRHGWGSETRDWKPDGNLENPTKFDLAPVEYLAVANQIYNPIFINQEKNRNLELFDVYEGEAIGRGNIKEKYRLVTYKGTGIIHTFYLLNNRLPFNRQRRIKNLVLGGTSMSHETMSGIRTLRYGYYDKDNTEVYRVIVKLNDQLTQGELFIGKYSGVEEFNMCLVKTMNFEPPLNEDIWLYFSYKFSDEIEKAILDIKS